MRQELTVTDPFFQTKEAVEAFKAIDRNMHLAFKGSSVAAVPDGAAALDKIHALFGLEPTPDTVRLARAVHRPPPHVARKT